MKKSILLIALIGIAIPSFAQATFYEGFFGSRINLVESVQRVIARSHPEKVEWVRAVRNEERKANGNGPLGVCFYGFPTRTFKQAPVTEKKDLYNRLMASFQKSLKDNHTLSRYSFKVPNPAHLTNLSAGQIKFLTNFLAQPMERNRFQSSYTPKLSHPKAAETELKFQVEGKNLTLLINSRDRAVYLFVSTPRPQAPQQARPAQAKTPASASRNLPTGRIVHGNHLVPSF